MQEPSDAQQPTRHGVPLWLSLSLVVGLAVIISTIVFLVASGGTWRPVAGWSQDDSEPMLIIHTRAPTHTPLPTSTRPRIIVPTLVPTHTATPTSAPTLTSTVAPTPTEIVSTQAAPTETATQSPTHTASPTSTATSTPDPSDPQATPHVLVTGDPVRLRTGPGTAYTVAGFVRKGDTLPLVGRTANGAWLQVRSGGRLAWVMAFLAPMQGDADQVPVVSDLPPTPTATGTPPPTSTPIPIPPPAPVLIDPPSGAGFADKVRFKFTWVRRLQGNERISLYVRSANGADDFDWWVSEADILAGGGAIHAQEDGVLYEVNSGIGALPLGKAFWRVAVVDDSPANKRQVSPWSVERSIFRK